MYTKTPAQFSMEVLSETEISQVSGGVMPLAVAVFYASGISAGIGAGWTFGRAFWSQK